MQVERALALVIDDTDWSDEDDHLLALQEKLNAYAAFIESGEVFEQFRDTVGPYRITDYSYQDQHPREVSSYGAGEKFIEHAQATFREAGFDLFIRYYLPNSSPAAEAASTKEQRTRVKSRNVV